MNIFCDMDGVLVRQTGRDGFDKMPWMPDGRVLWEFIAPMGPIILSMLPDENMHRAAPQKIEWCARELGKDVAVTITPDSIGKAKYAEAGDVLIDDNQKHASGWIANGGIFILHRSAKASISVLQRLLAVA